MDADSLIAMLWAENNAITRGTASESEIGRMRLPTQNRRYGRSDAPHGPIAAPAVLGARNGESAAQAPENRAIGRHTGKHPRDRRRRR